MPVIAVDDILEERPKARPRIYAYSIDDAVHTGQLKVGQTARNAVSTFASLPGKMTYGLKSGGDWKTGYLFDFIDLLIVDEAGQVLSEVAAPSFALAKRALVIGDTQQIEPISSISKAVDIGNLQSSGLLKDAYTEADLAALSSTGMRSADGSVMRLAQ